jgi:hypothetical protein
MKKTLLYLLSSLFPFLSFAHEGHGHTNGNTITHYLVEPEHLVVTLIVFTAVIVTFRYITKKEKRIDE